jgi:1-acyl-sn-glycerol-3-phosphate acyltransferase
MRNRFYNIASVIVFALLYIQTAVLVLITLPFAYFHFKKIVTYIVRLWAKSTFWFIGKNLKIYGLENCDINKHYILIANHASLFDIMAIMLFYPNISWFGHERLLKVPVFGQFLKMINYIPFREPNIKNTKQMIEEIIQKLKNNTIGIFPEGTRTLDGNLNNFFRGFIFILRSSNADILPVTLNGFYSLKPKNRFYINFGAKINVVVHKPINASNLKDKTDNEIIAEMKNIIEAGKTVVV